MRTTIAAALFLSLISLQGTCAEDRHFDSAGVEIRYVEQGQGEPVLLVHGFSRSIEINWIETGLMEALARSYRVIALDCRGHGRSRKPESADAYGRRMVEDLFNLLDHLKLEKAHVIGYSMGGRIGLKMAALHPRRVLSVVSIGAGGSPTGDDHTLWDEVAESLDHGDGIRPLILHMWPEGQPRPTEEQIRGINSATMAVNDSRALAAVARQYRELSLSDDEVARLDLPVFAVVGSDDPFRRDVETLKGRMPRLVDVVLDGAGHVDVLQRPDLPETLRSFLLEANPQSSADLGQTPRVRPGAND